MTDAPINGIAKMLQDLPRVTREQQEIDGTCPRCNGLGGIYAGHPDGIRVFVRCPARCVNGKVTTS